jgi:hypothetical protein
MPDDLHARVARADEIADALCAKRLLNAALTTMAAWLLCATLVRRDFLEVRPEIWFAVATLVTFATVAFSAWAFVHDDRRVWARAINHGSNSSDETAGK